MLEEIIPYVVPILPSLIIIIYTIIQNKKERQYYEYLSCNAPDTSVMNKIDDNDNDPYELVDVYLKLSCNGFSINSMREMLNLDKIENCNVNKSKHRPTNCVNCGAILHGNQCEYCGTEYNWGVYVIYRYSVIGNTPSLQGGGVGSSPTICFCTVSLRLNIVAQEPIQSDSVVLTLCWCLHR